MKKQKRRELKNRSMITDVNLAPVNISAELPVEAVYVVGNSILNEMDESLL